MGAATIIYGYTLVGSESYANLFDSANVSVGLAVNGQRVIATDRAFINRSYTLATLPAVGVAGRMYWATSIFNNNGSILFDNGSKYVLPLSLPGSAMRGDENIGVGWGSPRWNAWNVPITANRSASASGAEWSDGDEVYFARRSTATGAFTTTVFYGATNGSSRVLPIGQWIKLRFIGSSSTFEISEAGSL